MSDKKKEKEKEKKAVEKVPAVVESWDPFSWDPFRELDLFRGWPSLRPFAGLRERGFPSLPRWSPSVDVSESDNHYVVTVELPGAKKDDVRVEMRDGVLTIRGEKRSEREEEKEDQRYVERSYGMFSRSFTLPADANEDEVKASFKDGVLTIKVAKTEEKKPKTITVS